MHRETGLKLKAWEACRIENLRGRKSVIEKKDKTSFPV